MVGHELKSPLTVILQGFEALRNPQRGPLNPEQGDILAIARELVELHAGHIAVASIPNQGSTFAIYLPPRE